MNINIFEFEQLCQSEETLPKALEALKEEFERVQYWESLNRNNITDNPEEALKGLNEVTGLYGVLYRAYDIAETCKTHQELKQFDYLRSSAKEKFVAATATQQASLHVQQYRRVRNLINTYVVSAEKMIGSFQSVLNYSRSKAMLAKSGATQNQSG